MSVEYRRPKRPAGLTKQRRALRSWAGGSARKPRKGRRAQRRDKTKSASPMLDTGKRESKHVYPKKHAEDVQVLYVPGSTGIVKGKVLRVDRLAHPRTGRIIAVAGASLKVAGKLRHARR